MLRFHHTCGTNAVCLHRFLVAALRTHYQAQTHLQATWRPLKTSVFGARFLGSIFLEIFVVVDENG